MKMKHPLTLLGLAVVAAGLATAEPRAGNASEAGSSDGASLALRLAQQVDCASEQPIDALVRASVEDLGTMTPTDVLAAMKVLRSDSQPDCLRLSDFADDMVQLASDDRTMFAARMGLSAPSGSQDDAGDRRNRKRAGDGEFGIFSSSFAPPSSASQNTSSNYQPS